MNEKAPRDLAQEPDETREERGRLRRETELLRQALQKCRLYQPREISVLPAEFPRVSAVAMPPSSQQASRAIKSAKKIVVRLPTAEFNFSVTPTPPLNLGSQSTDPVAVSHATTPNSSYNSSEVSAIGGSKTAGAATPPAPCLITPPRLPEPASNPPGNPPPVPSAGAPGGGSGSAAPKSTGLFGSSPLSGNSSASAATAPSLLGGKSGTTTTAPTPSGGGLFSSGITTTTTATPLDSGLFGSVPATTAAPSSSGVFGSRTTTATTTAPVILGEDTLQERHNSLNSRRPPKRKYDQRSGNKTEGDSGTNENDGDASANVPSEEGQLARRLNFLRGLLACPGMDANHYDRRGSTVLIAFIEHLTDQDEDRHRNLAAILQLLVSDGPGGGRARVGARNREGETARLGRKTALKVLLERGGASVHVRDTKGRGVLEIIDERCSRARHDIALYGRLEAYRVLLTGRYKDDWVGGDQVCQNPRVLDEWRVRSTSTRPVVFQ
ncbi:hypothetical protein GGTG_04212 [Gaeumannomyces tritici R3-111a-1]|uniref:GED domain-containing protein n=1 Tax=Gaeumannomyces tritici (strain R3-111a-1) TaxID=644352 RepID=J3NSG0_GAET3|nr:hypothetical protein GGTG_04212 [Gaeumannomyces tritici R3-111a-1]EJT79123.1 hypothetical protein GGTG_04212 [Gaeumannomyces tritici R3-111a-1]